MGRIELFRKWLSELTTEKIELLIRLEKTVRLLTHVYELNGTNDEKILLQVRQISHELRRDYQRLNIVQEKVKDVNQAQ